MPTSLPLSTIIRLLMLAALAMSYGWGFRGDYGHEAGAMFPGAFLAIAILLTAGREDWQRRLTLAAFAAAVGWAFGGSVSYGMVVGYTADNHNLNVAYGYSCLFIIGAIWGSVGAGCLGLGGCRSFVEMSPGPCALYIQFSGETWIK